jgi:hypothetical protein
MGIKFARRSNDEQVFSLQKKNVRKRKITRNMFFNTCSTLRTNIHKFKGQRSHCANTIEKKNEYL